MLNEYIDRNLLSEKLTFSIKEAAYITGLSQGHLRNQHKLGKLKFIKSGRRTLILSEDLKKYLELLSKD